MRMTQQPSHVRYCLRTSDLVLSVLCAWTTLEGRTRYRPSAPAMADIGVRRTTPGTRHTRKQHAGTAEPFGVHGRRPWVYGRTKRKPRATGAGHDASPLARTGSQNGSSSSGGGVGQGRSPAPPPWRPRPSPGPTFLFSGFLSSIGASFLSLHDNQALNRIQPPSQHMATLATSRSCQIRFRLRLL